MNAYFFKMTNEERENILDQHKEIYDGYVTSYAQQPKEQPLYTQDFANDKQGLNVNNKGEVSAYSNLRINEMRHDGKSTGLFADEEPMEEGMIAPSSQFEPEESFESEDKDDDYYVSLGEQLDMIGDGDDDLDHGVFAHDDEDVIVTPEAYDDEDYYKSPFDSEDELDFTVDDTMFDDEDDIDDEEVEGLFEDLKESLDMFKRFTKYN